MDISAKRDWKSERKETDRERDRQPDGETNKRDKYIPLSFDKGNIEDWEVVVDELEQVDLQSQGVIKLGLCSSQFLEIKKKNEI